MVNDCLHADMQGLCTLKNRDPFAAQMHVVFKIQVPAGAMHTVVYNMVLQGDNNHLCAGFVAAVAKLDALAGRAGEADLTCRVRK